MQNYIVEDILGNITNRIYVLESPHTTEIELKIPASGAAGRVMSEVLFNSTTPFGIAIKNEEIAGVGIMNAVQFPLDEKVYQTVPDEIQSYVSIKKIEYSGNQFKDDIKNKVVEIDKEKTIVNFRKRLEKVVMEKGSTEIVVCGFISQAYVELAYPELINVRFKTWTKLKVCGNQINVRYTHHPSPKRNGVSWSI
jgi:hypothetical protein